MRAVAQAAAIKAGHSAAEVAPRMVARFSRSRPTMSRLIIARRSAIASPDGGVRVKWVEPRTPSSSPENAAKTTSRERSVACSESVRATSRSVAVPDALSSAPRCGATLSGASE